jgi:hypothetical protein
MSAASCAHIHIRVALEELDAKWTGVWQQSSVAAAAMQSEVSRMGNMVSEASGAAKAAAQMVAALTEAIAPLQQRLVAVEQHQQQGHAQIEQAQAEPRSVPTNHSQQEAPVPAAAAPAAPAAATWPHHGGDYQEEDSSAGGLMGTRQMARLEERLLSRLQRMLKADGSADGQPFRRVRPHFNDLCLSSVCRVLENCC